jgi:hypothetical protein
MSNKAKRQRSASAGSTQPIAVTTYAELERYATAFAAGHLNLLLVTGIPGVGKSRTVIGAVVGDRCLITGAATAFGMYAELFHHCNEPVVIDDVDSLYRDQSAVRLLKALCQSELAKTLMWNSATTTSPSSALPSKFETVSRVAIIANDWRQLNDDILALEDRGHVIQFAPSPLEVHTKAAEWFWDQEVFDFFAENLHFLAQPSFRHYVKAAELKSAGIAWQNDVLRWFLPDRERFVMQLHSDSRFSSQEDRVREFIRQGHGSRATFFNVSKHLIKPEAVPHLTLRHTERPRPATGQPLLDWLRQRHARFGSG